MRYFCDLLREWIISFKEWFLLKVQVPKVIPLERPFILLCHISSVCLDAAMKGIVMFTKLFLHCCLPFVLLVRCLPLSLPQNSQECLQSAQFIISNLWSILGDTGGYSRAYKWGHAHGLESAAIHESPDTNIEVCRSALQIAGQLQG